MAVPKKRRSKSKKRIKHSNWKVTAPNLRACKNCGTLGLSFHICASCGFYDGKQIITIKPKKEKKES